MIAVILLPVIQLLLITIDLILIVVTFKWVGALQKLFAPMKMHTLPVADDESHRITAEIKTDYGGKLLETPLGRDHIKTLYDFAIDAFKKYGDRNCMGQRTFLGWKVPKKVKHFGDKITWRTYEQIGGDAHKFGASLRAAGVVPAPETTSLEKVTTHSRIAIFENTCPEWMVACIGAFSQSISVVTVYATLGIDAVVEAVDDNLVTVMVCNKKSVADVISKKANMPTLKVLVYTNDIVGPDEKFDLPSAPDGLKVIAIEDFIAEGDVTKFPPTPPKAQTVAVVMYTSGSTGKPKGVIINHRSIVGMCATAEEVLRLRPGEEVYLAYLPLAHIMELMSEFVMMSIGCTLCYADPKSLSATGAYPIGAMEQYSPTVLTAVPKIWDVIKKGVTAKVELGSAIRQGLFKTAMQWRSFLIKNGMDTVLFKALVFKKLRAAVGGRLHRGLSGGGPLNSEVHDFCRTAFCIDLVQGYGLTETCAGLTIQVPEDLRAGIAGVVLPAVEVKLESTPDVGDKAGQPYLSTDRFDVNGDPVFGRGEIMVRGTCVSSGYYMMPDKTKEVFTEDGWFHTGDIGQFTSDGCLRIVDRKKNLVKLKGGEYIALEKMEMTYGNSSFVDAVNGGICCYGDGDMDRPIALMQLSEPVTMKWAKANGVTGDFETIKKSKELNDAVLKSFKEEHGKSELSHLEKIVAVSLLSSPWTPENGCLTAANKLQRRAVMQQFNDEFQETKKKGIF